MKLILKLSLFLCVLVIFEDASLSLTDYQIKKICKNKKRPTSCTKNLIEKRSKLLKGLFIEIPVVPINKR